MTLIDDLEKKRKETQIYRWATIVVAASTIVLWAFMIYLIVVEWS